MKAVSFVECWQHLAALHRSPCLVVFVARVVHIQSRLLQVAQYYQIFLIRRGNFERLFFFISGWTNIAAIWWWVVIIFLNVNKIIYFWRLKSIQLSFQPCWCWFSSYRRLKCVLAAKRDWIDRSWVFWWEGATWNALINFGKYDSLWILYSSEGRVELVIWFMALLLRYSQQVRISRIQVYIWLFRQNLRTMLSLLLRWTSIGLPLDIGDNRCVSRSLLIHWRLV